MAIFLKLIALFLVIMIISEDNLVTVIIYFSGFSLLMAGLYFVLRAPDVALAEASIGSAILPLVFLITIKQAIAKRDNND